MIEIYLLEHLQAFYEYGTLSEAARYLKIAQPSLSRSMKKLEELLGVELFERRKNRILLNDTGKLAAEYAQRILETEKEMERQIRLFDRSLHTITVGSCCPGPLLEFLPGVMGRFPGMAVSSEADTCERLVTGLKSHKYNIVILPQPLAMDGIFCRRYREEQLFVSVLPDHPAASCKEVSFAEMNGQNFIMYAHVGFWERIVREKMPESRFFLQEDIDAVGELGKFSKLPHFSSDITIQAMPSRRNGRVHVPFSDPESHVCYYLACLEQNRETFEKIFAPL